MLALLNLASAKPPALSYILPAGGQAGGTFDVKLEPSPEGASGGVWIDCPGVFLLPTGKDKARVIITDRAPLGLHMIRSFNAEGASQPRWFSIGTAPELAEVEPNDDIAAGQKCGALPLCVNGRLDKSGDVDGFTFEAEAGATIVASAECYALGSPVDAVLNLLDASGTRIATAHDGRSLDPVLTWKAAAAGKYTVQISGFLHPPQSSTQFTGGATAVYRLTITTGAAVTHAFPPVVTTSGKSKLELRGHNLTAKEKQFEIDGAQLVTGRGIQEIMPPVGFLSPVQVLVSPAAPVIEKEPNNSAAAATPMTQPGVAAGVIATSGDVDRFSFTAKKGERLAVRIRSKALGLPLDATLRIEGADGKMIASNDDQGESPDPLANFTAATDGVFQAVIADQFGKGGEAHVYALEIGTEQPDFEVTLTGANALVLQAGKTIEIAAKVKRIGGMTGALTATMGGLPAGVLAEPAQVDEKSGDVKLKLTATTTALPSNQAVTLSVIAKDAKPVFHRAAKYSLRGEERRGTTLRDESDQLWLTITP